MTGEAELEKRSNLVKVFSKPISSVLAQGSQVAQFSTARENVVQDGMGIADADTMVRSAESFVEQSHSIGGIFGDVIEKAKPLAKAYDIITLPKTIDPDTGLWPKERAKGRIEFKDVVSILALEPCDSSRHIFDWLTRGLQSSEAFQIPPVRAGFFCTAYHDAIVYGIDINFVTSPRRDAEILKGVTFSVQPGDTIGMTGSGMVLPLTSLFM